MFLENSKVREVISEKQRSNGEKKKTEAAMERVEKESR